MSPIYVSDQYDLSLSRTYPADPWASSVGVDGYASASLGDYGASEGRSAAGREGNEFRVFHYWHPNGMVGGPGNTNAYLQADLLFAGPDESLSVFRFLHFGMPPSDYYDVSWGATLTDLVSGPPREITSIDSEYPFLLTKTHVYRLEMYLEGSPFKMTDEISVTFTNVSQVGPAVPLPGAVWLGVLGLGCAGRRLRGRR